MVREVSTVGLPPEMTEGLYGWGGSEYSPSVEELVETLSVPVPEIRTAVAEHVPVEPVLVIGAKKGRRPRERTQDAASIRERILAAKRRAQG